MKIYRREQNMDKLTTKEAAKFAGIGVSTLNRKVSEKNFPQPIKIDRKNYYYKEEVKAWKKGNWVYAVIPDKLEQPIDAALETFNIFDEAKRENWSTKFNRFWDKYYMSYVLIIVAVLIMIWWGY